MEPWTHMPEKSGVDAALTLPLLLGAIVGATAWPKAGVAAAAASVTTKRKSRRCNVMLSSLFHGVPPTLSHKATPCASALGRGVLGVERAAEIDAGVEPVPVVRSAALPTEHMRTGILPTRKSEWQGRPLR